MVMNLNFKGSLFILFRGVLDLNSMSFMQVEAMNKYLFLGKVEETRFAVLVLVLVPAKTSVGISNKPQQRTVTVKSDSILD